jgi:hydroxyacylglutathione hydrolase
LIVHAIPVGAFLENSYIVADPESDAAAIVDPGADGEQIIEAVERMRRRVEAIWITHAHVDHIGAIATLKRKWNVPVYLHPLDKPLYRIGGRQAQLYGIPYEEPPSPDVDFAEGTDVTLGGLRLSVFHAPGHSPGHVVIHGYGNALVGDCIFAGSVGRTDLPFSNAEQLEQSLKRITALPKETVLHPGHGESTTVGEELISNPFLNGTARLVRSH